MLTTQDDQTFFPGGGETSKWKGRDTRRKIWIEPINESNMGVARFLFAFKRYQLKTEQNLH